MQAVTFRETQSFREPWIWAIVAVPLGLVFVTTNYGLVQQLIIEVYSEGVLAHFRPLEKGLHG